MSDEYVEVTDLPDESEQKILNNLADKGYAVVVFTPQELEGVRAKYVEDRMVEVGWEVIETLKGED